MSQRIYAAFTAWIFFGAAVAHLSRLIVGWNIELMDWVVPHWVSVPGLIIAGGLSAWGFRLASRPSARRKYTV